MLFILSLGFGSPAQLRQVASNYLADDLGLDLDFSTFLVLTP